MSAAVVRYLEQLEETGLTASVQMIHSSTNGRDPSVAREQQTLLAAHDLKDRAAVVPRIRPTVVVKWNLDWEIRQFWLGFDRKGLCKTNRRRFRSCLDGLLLLLQQIPVILRAGSGDHERPIEPSRSGEGFNHLRPLFFGKLNEFRRWLRTAITREAMLFRPVKEKVGDLDSAHDLAHPVDMVGVRVRQQNEIEHLGVVVAPHMFEQPFAVAAIARVNDSMNPLSIGLRVSKGDSVAVRRLLSH